MGGVGDFLFGSKPKESRTSTSQSGNYAYPNIMAAYGPAMGYTTSAGNMMGSLLGLNNSVPTQGPVGGVGGGSPVPTPDNEPAPSSGGLAGRIAQKKGANSTTPAPTPVGPTYTPIGDGSVDNQTAALQNWANSGGMKFIMDQGVKALETSQAGRGMLQSGATGKALEKYGQGLGSTYLNQYMDQLYKQAQLGLQSGGLIAGAGGWSKGTGESSGSGGKQGALPGLVSAAASIPGISDERLKKNIEYVFTNEQGLKIYDFEFIDPYLPSGRHRGPMAQEVREKLPEAFIEDFWQGYHGVDSSKVKGL